LLTVFLENYLVKYMLRFALQIYFSNFEDKKYILNSQYLTLFG